MSDLDPAYRSRQLALQQRCVHPEGGFTAFPRAALEGGVPSHFERQVELHGSRLAVAAADHRLTYTQLNDAANAVAHALLAVSDRPGEHVALLIEQGAASLIACLAVLKAGKVFVPLDVHWPPARARWVVRHARAAVVLASAAQRPLAHAVADAGQRIVVLDELPPSGACANPGLPIPADAPAYLLYTSGSTGRPKGVLDSHRNVLHEVLRLTHALHICPHDRQTLLRTSSAGAVSDTFTALLNGAALFPFDVSRSGLAGLASWLKREELTIWRSAPALFRALSGALEDGEQLPHLRVVFLCGEPAKGADLERFRAHFGPECLFVNCLGATEAATVTLHFSDVASRAETGILPVGYEVEDMHVDLVNEHGEVISGAGEGAIVVESRYLAHGYFDDPELTEAAFQEDPADPGCRRYVTGDLGRRLEDGNLVCLGRRDWRVNLHGRSFEPAEIEAALLEVDGIRDAVVTTTDGRGAPQLVAYVVPETLPGPTSAGLREALSQRIPRYMIPSRFVTLEVLPLTATGKVDRRALPAPTTHSGDGIEGTAEATNPIESALIRIWQRLFERADIGRDSDFFELGGDSLLALELALELEASLGRTLAIETLVHAPTIESLSRRIAEECGTEPETSLAALQPLGTRPPLFVFHGWRGNVFGFVDLARQFAPDQPVYGVQAVGLDGRRPRHASVEEMAAHYAAQIRSLQKEGPYHLAGHSAGGWFAYAVAEVLSRQKERVALLALMDTDATSDLAWWAKSRLLAQRARIHLAKLRHVPKGERLRFLARRSTALRDHMTHTAGITVPREDYYDILLSHYRPGRYAGDVLLLLGHDVDIPRRVSFWRILVAGKVKARRVSATHDTMLARDHVADLARTLRNAIDEAEGEAGRRS